MEPSLYIHIPFCKRKCIYCDFYSTIYDNRLSASYIDILIEQISSLSYKFPTIYIGGGTPTALDKNSLARLLKSLKRFQADCNEFTIEVNPESLDEEKIKLFLDSGVDRLSIGIQSLHDRKLKKLGRIHNSQRALDSVSLAAKRGFKNISIDLIFGLWDEEPGAWREELEEATKLPVTHISCYALTYEKNTPLFSALANKSIKALEDDIAASMYEDSIDILSLRGFKQYEISNFSKEGYQCKHNLNYWDNNQYIGLGASAVSYMEGIRGKNVSDIEEYIKGVKENGPLIESSEKLSPIKRAKETAAVKIRTKDGIDFKWFLEKTGFDFLKLEKAPVAQMVENGFIKYKKENNIPTGVHLRRKGFLFCDTISSALL